MRYFIYVEYQEPNPNELKVNILDSGNVIKTFEGQDPLIVWYDYYKFIYSGEIALYGNTGISSTVDHWFTDAKDYSEVYFNPDNLEDPFIDWRSSEMYDVATRYPKCIIKKGMNNFLELKKYYYQNKPKN